MFSLYPFAKQEKDFEYDFVLGSISQNVVLSQPLINCCKYVWMRRGGMLGVMGEEIGWEVAGREGKKCVTSR